MEDRFNITETRGKYSLHGNQSSFLDKLKKLFKNKNLKEEIILIKEIIRRNKPDYSDEDILALAREISKSGCTFVAAASNIMEQINYDEEKFYQLFKFPMRNSNGELNHDALIAELFSFMKDKAEFEVTGQYKTVNYDNVFEAAKNLLGKEFSESAEAFMALVNAGYTIDGNCYTKWSSEPILVMGDYKEFAKKELGIDVTSINELEQYLSSKKIVYHINELENHSKLSGLYATTFDKWMNYYFKEKNLDLEFASKKLECDKYEELIAGLKLSEKLGESISIGSEYNLSMTDGSRLGWFNFESVGPVGGHAMPFVGISDKGDFIITSWSDKYMVPKEFWNRMEFNVRKLLPRKREKEVTSENVSNSDAYATDIYDSINKKIAYIIAKLSTVASSFIDAGVGTLYKQIFTEEERAIISLEDLKNQIKNSQETNLGQDSFGRS